MDFTGRRQSGPVAVFGATGHTGRFVVAELVRRGMGVIAMARDGAALEAAGFSGQGMVKRQASVEDAASLRGALAGAAVVINCAGPFLETADAVADAAVSLGVHYLDLSAEQASTMATLERYGDAAREAGVAVIPSVGFYGGFADLLATVAMGEWDGAESIDVMIGLDSWHPTRGTRITGERNTAQRMVVEGGRLAPLKMPRAERPWRFGEPLGEQRLVEVPFSEMVLIARHLRAKGIHTYLSSVALEDLHRAETPAPRSADASGRSAQRFVVEVLVGRDGEQRRVTARGRDIYAFSAPLVCEVAQRVMDGRICRAGAGALGELLDAREVLAALTPEFLSMEMEAAVAS
ncbi:MAG: saccharopine dehydrogenase NADP-binding domain-containing protein [Acidobacteriaceae bacterium]